MADDQNLVDLKSEIARRRHVSSMRRDAIGRYLVQFSDGSSHTSKGLAEKFGVAPAAVEEALFESLRRP